MTNQPEPETARARLWRHGLPEDVIDGALALFAQELAGKIRAHRDHTRGAVQATKVMDFAADLISPETWARAEAAVSAVAPATDQTTPSRRAGLRDEIVKALGRIKTIPPVAHRREQADHVLAVLYREWPWLRVEAEDAASAEPAADRAALRDRIAEALANADGWELEEGLTFPGLSEGQLAGYRHRADTVLSVLPSIADRATLLRELADQQEATATTDVIRKRRSIATARRLFAVELRRMAAECAPAVVGPADNETQLPSIHGRDVSGFCPACGHGVLMLGDDGHVTCTLMDCPKPEAADELLHAAVGAQQRKETRP